MMDKPKILIVDDKQENLLVLEAVLQDLDVDIVKVNSGKNAIKAVAEHQFSLALLDIQMPEMDGFELAKIIKEEKQSSELPFIFISAIYSDTVNIAKAYELGAFSFISKPFEPEIIINKVKYFIKAYQNEKTLKSLNKDLEKKNSELQFLNQELESFTYSVSHDLRAPLRAINSYAQILIDEHGGEINDEIQRLLKIITTNALTMGELIDNLLSLSKLGQRQLVKQHVPMQEIIHSVISEEMAGAKYMKEITWRLHKIEPCNGDAHLLKQVMINLISNSIKYSSKKEKPEIELGSLVKSNEIIYFVKDNGAGFDMDYSHILFNVFQRLHKSSEFEGTGIGLAIVKRIIQRHGGKVWAEGVPGQGACFYFSLSAD